MAATIGLLACSPTSADEPTTHLVLNEIMFDPAANGSEWIELFNPGPDPVNVEGFTIANQEGVVATLPGWEMPAQSFLLIDFSVGKNDEDFSKGNARFHVGQRPPVLDNRKESIGLYRDKPTKDTIVDYVAYALDGDRASGAAYQHAIEAGIWPEADFFDQAAFVETGSSIGRNSASHDTDTSEDWWGSGRLDALGPTPGAANAHELGYQLCVGHHPVLTTMVSFGQASGAAQARIDMLKAVIKQIRESHTDLLRGMGDSLMGDGEPVQEGNELVVGRIRFRFKESLTHDGRTAVVREKTEFQGSEVLTFGGNAITVTHVNDAGPGLGTGTLADPLGSLTDASGSTSDIVFVHADSDFNGQQYSLAAGQRFLGEATGVDHTIETDQLGTLVLPRATTGTRRPIIDNAPGNALRLASGSEVSGVEFRNTTGMAILADNTVTGPVLVSQVVVNGGGGLQVNGASGDLRFNDLSIANTSGPGLQLTNVAGGVTIGGGSISNAAGAGIAAENVDTLLISAFDIDGITGPALQLGVGGAQTMNATIANNLFVGNSAPSVFGFSPNTGSELRLNLFGNEDSAGFELQRDAAGQLRLGGTVGTGGLFNDDNGNVANNGNTSNGGAPNVIISGTGNQIQIIDPLTVPRP